MYLNFINDVYNTDFIIENHAIVDWLNMNAVCLINSHEKNQYIIYTKNEKAFENICIVATNYTCDIFQFIYQLFA